MTDHTNGEMPTTHLDGNAAAGALGELFAFDVTVASGRCAGCGRVASMADTHSYPDAPGLVIRCPACAVVLLRVVRSPERTWLDLRGLAYLEVAGPTG
jgi:phage FluMu protein Com